MNTVTASHKFSLVNRGKLTQSIQMQLSKNEKGLSEFLSAFLKCKQNFETFKKKDDPHR